MKGLPEERAEQLARYMIEHEATVRQAAAQFGVSKSTVHKDITTRLEKRNAALYRKVQQVLRKNKDERHIRGGMATREKYRARLPAGRPPGAERRQAAHRDEIPTRGL